TTLFRSARALHGCDVGMRESLLALVVGSSYPDSDRHKERWKKMLGRVLRGTYRNRRLFAAGGDVLSAKERRSPCHELRRRLHHKSPAAYALRSCRQVRHHDIEI